MRIVGGALRGRPLAGPTGKSVRPTTDRVREALFNILAHAPWADGVLDDTRAIDGCCGSGALGLEALSRGCSACTFIDNDPTSIALAQKNARSLGVDDRCAFLRVDLAHLPTAQTPASLILIDAPYRSDLAQTGLLGLLAAGWVAEGAIAVLELPKAATDLSVEGFTKLDDRRYGDSRLLFLRRE